MPAIVFTVKGFDDLQRGFRALRQPELKKTVQPGLQGGSKQLLVPEIRKQAKSADKYSPSRSRHRGKRGRKGPLATKVTTKLVQRRHLPKGAIVAYSTAPRAWYRHFVIKGTRPHSLAKGAKLATGIKQNEGRQHPGADPNDFVGAARRIREPAFVRFVNEVVMRTYKSRSKAK